MPCMDREKVSCFMFVRLNYKRDDSEDQATFKGIK